MKGLVTGRTVRRGGGRGRPPPRGTTSSGIASLAYADKQLRVEVPRREHEAHVDRRGQVSDETRRRSRGRARAAGSRARLREMASTIGKRDRHEGERRARREPDEERKRRTNSPERQDPPRAARRVACRRPRRPDEVPEDLDEERERRHRVDPAIESGPRSVREPDRREEREDVAIATTATHERAVSGPRPRRRAARAGTRSARGAGSPRGALRPAASSVTKPPGLRSGPCAEARSSRRPRARRSARPERRRSPGPSRGADSRPPARTAG